MVKLTKQQKHPEMDLQLFHSYLYIMMEILIQ